MNRSFDFVVLMCRGRQLDLRDDLRQLPEITLATRSGDFITELARQAQDTFGVDWEFRYHHFVTEPKADGRRFQVPFLSAYVEDDGSLFWTKSSLDGVTVAHLERTRSEELFHGDPHALLIEEPVGGDGVLPVWDDLVSLLARLAEVGGGVTVLAQAAKGFLSLVRKFQKQWRLRNAMPSSLLRLILEREVWEYARLARYLGISLPVTVEILEYLGYEQDSTDPTRYRMIEGSESTALRAAIERDLIGNPRENDRFFWEVQGTTPPD